MGLIFKRLNTFTIGNSGLEIVINKDKPDFSVPVNIQMEQKFRILAYLRSFDPNKYNPTDFKQKFELGLIIFNLSEEQVLAECINRYISDYNNKKTTAIQRLVNDLRKEAKVKITVDENKDKGLLTEIAKQVGQVGFWIIAAQAGIALALGIPGEAVMGLVGPQFVGGAMALAFLLAAEVTAATAVVSESALVYMARHRNLLISLGMLMVQALVSVGLIILVDDLPIKPEHVGLYQATAVACGLMISLGIGSLIKSRVLSHLLGQPIRVWRWPLLIAVTAAALLGFIIVSVPARFEWVELTIGIPAILGLYGWIVWRWGFGPEDRVLFRKKRD
jgi:hypothetical protein